VYICNLNSEFQYACVIIFSTATEIIPVTRKLQRFYKNERNKDREDDWISYQPEHFANISTICYNERCATLKQIQDVAKVTHKGTLIKKSAQPLLDSYTSSCKKSSCVSDIFKFTAPKNKSSSYVAQNIILIEGVPGIGKTVLSREIAFQWASGQLLCNKHLLFLIHLRDPQIQQIVSLEQFVSYALNSNPNNKLVKIAVEYLETNDGDFSIIIFDGYDEISEEVKKDSFVAGIIKRKILPFCDLVITSRPSASADLYKIIDCRVEILGFTKEDRDEYICKNVCNEEIKKIQEYLGNNPFINDLCYIPLNMTILLWLFKEFSTPDNAKLPKTQTDINCQFIYITMSRFISRKEKKKITIKSPSDLEIPYKKQFSMLCKLAYDLLGNEKVVFSNEDIQKCISKKSSTNWSTLGLLRETNYYNLVENEPMKSYSYAHLSMQECLAAHYIASTREVENNFLKNWFWDPKYLNTGVMYVGLIKGNSTAFKNILCGHLGTFGKLFGVERTTTHDKVKKLHFFQCLLEAKNDELSQQLRIDEILYENTIDLSDHILQQKDIHTLGFFLLRSGIKHWEKLDLSNCCVSDDELEKFSAFSNSEVTNIAIEIIDLSHNNLSSHSVDTIVALINCFKVKKIVIADKTIEAIAFKDALLLSVAKVEKVIISSSGESSNFLINYESNSTNQGLLNQSEFKRNLYVWNSNVLSLITNLIVKCNAINIYEGNLPDEKVSDIAFELKTICAERNIMVAYVLQSTNKIFAYEAEFYQILQSFKSESFLMHDDHSESWKIVDMRQCNIGDENFASLNKLFCDNHLKYLDKLIISQCGLTSLSIQTLLETLKCCIIKYLIISDNPIHSKTLCSSITAEIVAESKILNFKKGIPLMLHTEEAKTLFFINCTFDHSAMLKDYSSDDLVNFQLYFSNNNLSKTNIQSFVMLCKDNRSQINVFEMNITDEIINDILTALKPLQDSAYVLASGTKLFAYKAKQQQIMEAIANNSAIVTLQLNKCEIDFWKVSPLGNLLSESSQNWELIDLSECDIGDEGCLTLFECFSKQKSIIYIKVLNLSSTCLTLNSVLVILKIFQFCIIKTLIISRNAMLKFNKMLHTFPLTEKHFLNFAHKIPLLVCETINDQSPYEMCSVYAFQASEPFDMETFQFQTVDNTSYNLYHVYIGQKCQFEFDLIFSIFLTTSVVAVTLLEEGVMNEKICVMIRELTKLKYDQNIRLSKVDFSRIKFTEKLCNMLCSSLFNDTIPFNFIGELDFSSLQLSLSCVPLIIESLQYCTIRHLVLPSNTVLDTISKAIVKDTYAEKKICNFIENVPLTVNIEAEVEEDDEITYSIIANTYIKNYQVRELFEHDGLLIDQLTTSHTFVLLECLGTSNLFSILSILGNKEIFKICIFEIRMSNENLLETVNHFKAIKRAYRKRLQYVLASDTKIIAYNVQEFQIIQALQIIPRIHNLEITHCLISKEDFKAIALYLMGTFDWLKDIKVTGCKIKDEDLGDFCEILCSAADYTSIYLRTVDFSCNYLTSSCIGTILKLLQCCIIETLIISNNSINDNALTDAIFQLIRYEGDKIHNLSSGIPLAIINGHILRNSLTNKGLNATIFIMNCKIDKKTNGLLLKHRNKVKKIYFVNSIVAFGDLRMSLSMLRISLPNDIKIIVYERGLKDEVAQEAIACLIKEAKLHIGFIISSKTRLLANNSSYHLVAPLLEGNSSIILLQLTNFGMQFPNDGRFLRALTNTSRNWEIIDLSGCNIRDDGCLALQKCFIASKSIIEDLNFKYNNLSSASAVAIASIITHCCVKRVNISHNRLQDDQVKNALSHLEQISTSITVNVEITASNSTAVIISNTNPEHLSSKKFSSGHKVQLTIMHYHKFDHIESILSSFSDVNLSQVTLQNSCLTMEQIEEIVNILPAVDLHIEEPHICYNSNFIAYTLQSLMTVLLKITKDESSTLSPISSLVFSKVHTKGNKICVYDIKMLNSVKHIFTKFIQTSEKLVAIKLSNCYVTLEIASKLASVIKINELKLFELSCNYIKESNFKVITEALKVTKSLIFFAIKSVNCSSEDIGEDIANVIARNNKIEYLEITNCSLKQTMIIRIAKSIKELRALKQLNLSNNVLTCEALIFVLEDKCMLEQLNLSQCKLQKPEILKIASTLKTTELSSINFSNNNITDYAAKELISLFSSPSVSHVEMSNCNLQEGGMSSIINALKYKSLDYLNFSGNKITDLLATEIAAGISNNPWIRSLDLSNCNLQEIGIEEILTSLKVHTSNLNSLKFSSFTVNEEMVKLFEHVLDNNINMKSLTLQDCNCEGIFNAFRRKKISSLQLLDISSSIISLHNLIFIVTNNGNLKHLDISNCDVQGEVDIIGNNFPGLFLEYLNISGNTITKTLANFISNVISFSCKLKHINLNSCEMKESEFISITNSLKMLTKLNHLNCSNNVISIQVAENIANIIKNNVHLEHLDISLCNLTEKIFSTITNALKQVRMLKVFVIHSNYIRLDAAYLEILSDKNLQCANADDYDAIPLPGSEITQLYSSNDKSEKKSMHLLDPYKHAPQETDETISSYYSNTGDCDTISIATGETMLPYSSEKSENALRNSDIYEATTTQDVDEGDYDTISLVASEVKLSCCSTKSEYESLNPEIYETIFSRPCVTDKTMLSCHPDSYDTTTQQETDEGDYDTISLVASEMRSSWCGTMSENTSLNPEIYKTASPRPCVTDKTMLSCHPDGYDTTTQQETDEGDYDTISLVASERPSCYDTKPGNMLLNPEGTFPEPYVTDKTTLSCYSESNSDDFDTMSLATIELTLHHSDKESENELTNLNFDTTIHKVPLTEKMITSDYSDKTLEDSGYPLPTVDELTENSYATIPALNDNSSPNKTVEEKTFHCYDDVSIATDKISDNNKLKSTDNYENVIAKKTPIYSSHNSERDNYENILSPKTSKSFSRFEKTSGNTSANDYEDTLFVTNGTKPAHSSAERSESKSIDDYKDVLSNADQTITPTEELYDIVSLTNAPCSSVAISEMKDVLSNADKSITPTEDLYDIVSLTNAPSEAITSNCFIEHLDISDYVISEITEVIAFNCFIEHLDISDCKLSDSQISTVVTALSKISTLKHFNISSNEVITDDTAIKIASVITSNLLLQSVNLSNCHLQEDGIIKIANALANITSLLSLDMSENVITIKSTHSLAVAIRENLLLEQLNLSHCFEHSAGIYNILIPLTMSTYLKHLDLCSCYINDKTSELLAVVIANNKSLSHLDLSGCKLQDKGLIIIAKKLQVTDTLKYLSLSSNFIINEAAYEIALGISNNFSLQHLALSNCKLQERGFIDTAEALLNISSLKHLDLGYNAITDRAAVTLANGIANNMTLEYLDLRFCTWQDTGPMRIHKVINKLPIIKEVDIR